jgi:hypothetical protein
MRYNILGPTYSVPSIAYVYSISWSMNSCPFIIWLVNAGDTDVWFILYTVNHRAYRYIQITWYLSSLTLLTAVAGTVRPLLGSRRHGQAMLYLFQKYLLWECEYTVYRNKIAYVKVKFYVFYQKAPW